MGLSGCGIGSCGSGQYIRNGRSCEDWTNNHTGSETKSRQLAKRKEKCNDVPRLTWEEPNQAKANQREIDVENHDDLMPQSLGLGSVIGWSVILVIYIVG